MNFHQIFKYFFPRKKVSDIVDYDVFNKKSRELKTKHYNLMCFNAKRKVDGKFTNVYKITDTDGNEFVFDFFSTIPTRTLGEFLRELEGSDEDVILNYTERFNPIYIGGLTSNDKIKLGQMGGSPNRIQVAQTAQEKPEEKREVAKVEEVESNDGKTVVSVKMGKSSPVTNVITAGYVLKGCINQMITPDTPPNEKELLKIAESTVDDVLYNTFVVSKANAQLNILKGTLKELDGKKTSFEKEAVDLVELYRHKNRLYGNAIQKGFRENGEMSIYSVVYNKFERLKTLVEGDPEDEKVFESKIDTILDLASYLISYAVELKNK